MSLLSIEELMTVEITTLNKRPEKLKEAPSAIYVITSEEIKRSGATSIPEILRLAPGVTSTRFDAKDWGLGIRGFPMLHSNKLMVLVDGRSIYTPMFSGVLWNFQDIVLEDIAQIEVIRGPGATMWGTNAVNGVINIITKSAAETQGTMVTALGGNEDTYQAVTRYGGKAENFYYRVYSKASETDGSENVENYVTPLADYYRNALAGFRMDSRGSIKTNWTIQGEGFQGYMWYHPQKVDLDPLEWEIVDSSRTTKRAHLMGKLDHEADSGKYSIQAYVDHHSQDSLSRGMQINTYDVDFQHELPVYKRNKLYWGLGYRYVTDSFHNTYNFFMKPEKAVRHIFSAFIHDEITITDSLKLSGGIKYEKSDYTDGDIMPNLRLAYTMNEDIFLWASAAKAVRNPSRWDKDSETRTVYLPGQGPPPYDEVPIPAVHILAGTDEFTSEKMKAYEAGFRYTPTGKLLIDTAFFYNDYYDLASYVSSESDLGISNDPITHLYLYEYKSNDVKGLSRGVEVLADWRPVSNWKLLFSYSYIDLDMTLTADNANRLDENIAEGDTPQNQWSVRSYYTFKDDYDIDIMIYRSDAVDLYRIDPYTKLDVRLAWRPSENTEISVVGQNLMEETTQQSYSAAVEQSYYIKADINF
ncbi:TonB-dependent receptor plug domain-containing protein [Limisalsivibrio acetivorans]|uniref:TonB-dependent receptor plug domain-containing protein n=1 Tax=Limisalsivibrio acetivorans TaxID=1304888 RepID=UPI0003F7B474|nr:TonB-dependent receptor [Limisalsivibrio acetivorans]